MVSLWGVDRAASILLLHARVRCFLALIDRQVEVALVLGAELLILVVVSILIVTRQGCVRDLHCVMAATIFSAVIDHDFQPRQILVHAGNVGVAPFVVVVRWGLGGVLVKCSLLAIEISRDVRQVRHHALTLFSPLIHLLSYPLVVYHFLGPLLRSFWPNSP